MEDLSSWKEKFEVCVYTKKLIDKLEYLNTKVKNPVDIEEVKKGIYYAHKYHGSQMRQSGDPYYSHPIEVAIMVAEFVANEASKLFTHVILQAALLHDTIEDTELTKEIITETFGIEAAKHVEELTRVKPYGKISAAESLDLLIKDINESALIIKFFDRMHNMQTISAKSSEKIKKIVEETLQSFLSLAVSFDVCELEQEFIKLCFKSYAIERPIF